jgi:hypothetical protein
VVGAAGGSARAGRAGRRRAALAAPTTAPTAAPATAAAACTTFPCFLPRVAALAPAAAPAAAPFLARVTTARTEGFSSSSSVPARTAADRAARATLPAGVARAARWAGVPSSPASSRALTSSALVLRLAAAGPRSLRASSRRFGTVIFLKSGMVCPARFRLRGGASRGLSEAVLRCPTTPCTGLRSPSPSARLKGAFS